MKKVMRDILIFWSILAVGAFLMVEFCQAKDLNVSVGYIHKWLLDTPSFEGASFIQDWLSNKLGIPLPQGTINYGPWKIRNTYDSRDTDTKGGSGVRISLVCDTHLSELFILGIGIDWSFNQFEGSATSTPMSVWPLPI